MKRWTMFPVVVGCDQKIVSPTPFTKINPNEPHGKRNKRSAIWHSLAFLSFPHVSEMRNKTKTAIKKSNELNETFRETKNSKKKGRETQTNQQKKSEHCVCTTVFFLSQCWSDPFFHFFVYFSLSKQILLRCPVLFSFSFHM